ncbi:FAD/NAD(P)-binding domain-containing protein [Plenodomus tracheiphilus IPT5]|uniref:FAD/NAD(P)-binding domain-containing protein n=1 Tax=Plenodomus tracheiphilus IPT5 TaxID=1408161 RepID=A0A6A7AWG8_9PLEO|nr:FAD/NAD(P)-binding domain-containing protein [Plenodomus tracheiphilus IPT5]
MAKSAAIPNVVVIGGSYVGLNLAESLATSAQGRYRILLVEKNSHFQHLFAFPRYAITSRVDAHKAFIPFQKSRLGERGAIVQAKVVELTKDLVVLDGQVDIDGKQTDKIPYAALAIATGTKLSPPGTLPESNKFGGTAYLQKHAARVEKSHRIVVVGGGAVGVQMATDIKEIYPAKSVTLVHSRANVMNKFHPGLHDVIKQRCDELNLQLILGQRVKLPEGGYPTDGREFNVLLNNGTQICCDLAIISTGQTPQSDVLQTLAPSCIDAHGFIKVKDTLQVQHVDFPNIFALGDIAATDAHKAARPALKQVEVVRDNIQRLLSETTHELVKYAVTDPAAIHLTLGVTKSVIFRNPSGDGSEEGSHPVIMHKNDGELDMGIAQLLFTLLWLANGTLSKLLVDYNAERGDDVSKIGRINLEQARGEPIKSNTDNLYIKAGKDWRGSKSAHFHRKKAYIRCARLPMRLSTRNESYPDTNANASNSAEIHALDKQTKAGESYYLTYSFALSAIPNSLMVWQWKEYEANNKGGANIPLSLEVKNNQIFLAYQADGKTGRITQWTADVKPDTVYNVGLEILAKSSGGHVKLYWNGEQVTFSTNKEKTLIGNMFPGRSDPKIGIYRGEDVETNSFVYQFQIGTEQKDVDSQYFG